MFFSEVSTFLLKNWSQLEKVHNAEKNLQKEISDLLYSLESVLSQKYWWDSEVNFFSRSINQVYISRTNWSVYNSNLIWIGVENFTIESLFGSGLPPICFLYCLNVGDREEKRDALLDIMAQDGNFNKYLADKKGYVLIRQIKKYTATQYEALLNGEVLDEIADFIEAVYLKIKDYQI
jgi:hypothetical protein